MKPSNCWKIGLAFALGVILLLMWLTLGPNPKTPETPPQKPVNIAEERPRPPEREFNDQQGLSGQEIYEKVMAEMEAKGGGLQMWKDDMQRVTQEAQQIKTVKMTPELATYLDKVNASLWGGGQFFNGEGIEITSLLDAKRAAVLDARQSSLPFYTIPSKAVLYKNVVYFAPASPGKNGLGEDIPVPNDFSKGIALKMDEKNYIKRYVWNFHKKPPADGIIGITTETE
ncbi:MAG: hypothetical protein JWL81_1919 [Verrucomicrobiales bacterium]|nr:hypothetical protein [Verrucomicrobiales bacterium]